MSKSFTALSLSLRRTIYHRNFSNIYMSTEPPNKVAKMTETKQESINLIQNSDLKADAKKLQVQEDFNKISEDGSKLLFKKLSDKATEPLRASRNAAGFDLYSAADLTIPAGTHKLIPTDIAIAIPKGSYGRIAPKSGLTKKHGLDVGAGVIDYDYRGNVGVILFNHLKTDFEVTQGLRIAQLVIEKIFMPSLEQVTDLDETERGSGGFGSTGR